MEQNLEGMHGKDRNFALLKNSIQKDSVCMYIENLSSSIAWMYVVNFSTQISNKKIA